MRTNWTWVHKIVAHSFRYGASFARTAPGSWLLGHVPWTEAEHRIAAANVTRATSAVLEIEPTAACLVLERQTWRGEDRITHVRLTFPGEAYDLVARFSPQPSPSRS